MTLPAVDPTVLADAGNLTALKQAAAAHNPQALREAAQQFESLFTSMMLKSMRQASFSDPLFGSDQADMYQDMYDDQIAAEISKGRGLGLADMLVQQLRRSGLPGTAQETSAATSTSSPAAAATGAAASPATSVETSGPASSPAGTTTSGAASSPTAAAAGGTPSAPAAATAATSNASSCPSTAQQLQFAQSLWPEARQAAQQLGVSPVSLLAQAALETDWGHSMPRTASGATSNNLFGIKAGAGWNGGSVQSSTQEYDSGTATAVKAQFRSYATPSQCFSDYVSLLQSNPRYAAALGTGGNTQAFAAALQRGGYATDPAYAAKLGSVANTLTRALTQARQTAAAGGYPAARSLKSAASLPTTSGSNTL
ncbi:MAG: flagellar assembly peptidoglycan hydrolase FlgJ [Steroidobacteraceae bacterium]